MAGLRANESMLLVIDMQTRLIPAIHDSEQLLRCARALVQAANMLDVPVVATEHCMDKIGPTVDSLKPHIGRFFHKTHFNAVHEPGFQGFLPTSRPNVLLIGTEAHVCVLQTARGLAELGLHPILVADGIGSRYPSDHAAALQRAAHHGIEVVTAEMAIFEWLDVATHVRFKEALALLKTIRG